MKRSFLATAAALALFGCGSLPGSTTVSEAAARLEHSYTAAAVEEAVLKNFAAYQSGDVDEAFSALTRQCRRSILRSDFTKLFKFDVMLIEILTDSKLSDLELRDVSVTDFSGGRAKATALLYLEDGALASDPQHEGQAMVYEDGRWRFDCPIGP
jgi:hypothetical protein